MTTTLACTIRDGVYGTTHPGSVTIGPDADPGAVFLTFAEYVITLPQHETIAAVRRAHDKEARK